ncbi:sigma-70 family RNA polymerase sigma factor [Psychrobacillus sp. FSL K6-1464]|uniref:sigma-70 family RNA polymerase sigma factor n=1 Tax=Psychrobacillus sp. FSL K6-1464 TaxID=2921545 RepID=UPI0030F9317F
MKITSENFIKHLKKQREDALEYVMEEYIGIVKATIYNSLKSYNDPQSVEECINDTFLGVYDNSKQFEGDKEDFRRWICTIAKFKAIDKQRKLMKTEIATEDNEMKNSVKSAEDEFLVRSSTQDLLKMMTQLEPLDRDIFTMKFFLNMKNEEISQHLGLTKASVDNRIYRGKKRLQQIRLGGILT